MKLELIGSGYHGGNFPLHVLPVVLDTFLIPIFSNCEMKYDIDMQNKAYTSTGLNLMSRQKV